MPELNAIRRADYEPVSELVIVWDGSGNVVAALDLEHAQALLSSLRIAVGEVWKMFTPSRSAIRHGRPASG